MEKGPLEGQTLEFVPGSKIRIGRILRGNTISIKDAGISTKHLAINFEFTSGRWTLSDLGSSNGTVLNSNDLEPFSQVQLSDGDTIKLGEYTSIKVQIRAVVEAEEGKVRRNPPRLRGGKLEFVGENVNNENERGEMVKEKGGEVSDSNEGDNGKMENFGKKGNLKRTRNKNNKEGIWEDKNGVENVFEIGNMGRDEAVVKPRPRRGRGVKNEEILGVCMDSNQNVGEGAERNRGNVETLKRITRNMRKGGNIESKESEKVLPVAAVKDGENASARRITRSAVNEGKIENLEELGNKNTKKGRRGRRNLKVETSIEAVKDETGIELEMTGKLDLEVKEDFPVKEVLEEQEGRVVDGTASKEEINSGTVGCGDALGSTSAVKDVNSHELDLEKMTLGDWLDHLEVNLPKQIVHDTEEMILGMRQKAKKFHEFMMQQKNPKRQG